MRFFFRSRQFKIIITILAALVALSVISAIIGGRISPHADIVGTVTAPFRAAATRISQVITDFTTAYSDGNAAMLENAELQKEINELRYKLADYEEMAEQNLFYKDYLEIKEQNPDFKLAPATLISRDNTDPYKSFVINKGSIHGIKENDPVITDAGLVGRIGEVGLTTSKVVTVLSPDITLGALGNRTNDSGLISGNLEFARNSLTRFYNLSRSCNVAVGDYVVTSGEGIFPGGLLVGRIATIGNDEYNTSIFASVEPFVNLDEVRGVMVITEFDGQGGIIVQDGE